MAVRRGGLLCLPFALALLAGGGSGSGSSSARAAGPLPAASSEAFDSVLGNTASCHRACQLTYSLHTYPKVRAGPASRLPAAALGGAGPIPASAPLPFSLPRELCCRAGWRAARPRPPRCGRPPACRLPLSPAGPCAPEWQETAGVFSAGSPSRGLSPCMFCQAVLDVSFK